MNITVEVPIAWGDMDALGHVNNTVYLRWFETARIALFDALGVDANRPSEIGPILATTTCNFRRPLAYPGTVRVTASVSRVGNTSFVVDYDIQCDGETAADGTSVIVLVNYATGAKIPVPSAMRARLS